MSNRVRCFQTLSLDEPVRASKCRKMVDQLFLDGFDGFENALARRHVVALGIHREARDAADDLSGERIEVTQLLDLVVEQLDTDCILFRIRRKTRR